MFSKSRAAFIGLALVFVAAAAQTASAATVRATFSGIVDTGSDQTGLFVTPGGLLDGQAFSLIYTFDTALGSRDTSATGELDAVSGGAYFGSGNPTLSAELTIAGQTHGLSGVTGSSYFACAVSYCGQNSYTAEAYDFTYNFPGISTLNYFSLSASGPDGAIPIALDTPFVLSNATGSGSFFFQSFDTASWSFPVSTTGNLTVTHLSVERIGVAPVPLPAAVGPFLLVLGMSGFVARRRRQRGQA